MIKSCVYEPLHDLGHLLTFMQLRIQATCTHSYSVSETLFLNVTSFTEFDLVPLPTRLVPEVSLSSGL